MTRTEQMIVAAVHGFLWVVICALTESKSSGYTADVVYMMALILLYVLPAPAMAWKIRSGLDFKAWTRITVQAWLTAAFVIAVLCRLGFIEFIQEKTRYASMDLYIFAGMFLLPVTLGFVVWVTRENHRHKTYPIRSARRKINGKASNSVPFSSEMGTRL